MRLRRKTENRAIRIEHIDLMKCGLFGGFGLGVEEVRGTGSTLSGQWLTILSFFAEMSNLKTVPTLQKYGLQKRSGGKKPPSSSVAPSFFNTDLDDLEEEDNSKGEKNLNSRTQIRNHLNLQRANHKLMQASSSDMPTLTPEEAKIYDYDGAYDDLKEQEKDKYGKMNLLGKDEPVSVVDLTSFCPQEVHSSSLPVLRNQDTSIRFKPQPAYEKKKKIESMSGLP
jgi:hypothetical protein